MLLPKRYCFRVGHPTTIVKVRKVVESAGIMIGRYRAEAASQHPADQDKTLETTRRFAKVMSGSLPEKVSVRNSSSIRASFLSLVVTKGFPVWDSIADLYT